MRRDAGRPSRFDGGPDVPDFGRPHGDLGGGPRIDGSMGVPPLATPYEACIELSRLVCIGQVTCCPEGGGPAPDVSFCDDPRSLGCDWFLMDERWTDGTIRYDSADARRLYQTFASALPTCDEVDTRWTDKTGIFRGTLPEGADCQRGDPFLNYLSCEPGTRCVWLSGVEGVCGPMGEEGDRCSVSVECNVGLFCDREVPGTYAKCMPLRPLGASCSSTSSCSTYRCHEGRCAEPTEAQSWCPPMGSP